MSKLSFMLAFLSGMLEAAFSKGKRSSHNLNVALK